MQHRDLFQKQVRIAAAVIAAASCVYTLLAAVAAAAASPVSVWGYHVFFYLNIGRENKNGKKHLLFGCIKQQQKQK